MMAESIPATNKHHGDWSEFRHDDAIVTCAAYQCGSLGLNGRNSFPQDLSELFRARRRPMLHRLFPLANQTTSPRDRESRLGQPVDGLAALGIGRMSHVQRYDGLAGYHIGRTCGH